FLLHLRPPNPTLFPYTTLFRSTINLLHRRCNSGTIELFPGNTASVVYNDIAVTTDANGQATDPLLPCDDNPMTFQATPPDGSGQTGTAHHRTPITCHTPTPSTP